jgi:hypothetical protein
LARGLGILIVLANKINTFSNKWLRLLITYDIRHLLVNYEDIPVKQGGIPVSDKSGEKFTRQAKICAQQGILIT